MKCKAAEVLHDKQEQACGAEYGLIFLEFIDCMISDQMMAQHKWRGKRLQWLYDTRKEAAECAVSHIRPETWVFGKNKSAFRAFPNCAPGSWGSLEWAIEMANKE